MSFVATLRKGLGFVMMSMGVSTSVKPCASSERCSAAFTCADLDLTPAIKEDHAAYVGNWLTVLKNVKRAIFTAASHAQRAADFLTNTASATKERAA